MATVETKACALCAKSKRRCSRGLPACARCVARSLPCIYPASKQTCWVMSDYMGVIPIKSPASTATTNGNESGPLPSPLLGFEAVIRPLPPMISPSPGSLTLADLQSAWFLTPDTWVIRQVPAEAAASVIERRNSPMLERFARQMKNLMTDWVEKGSSGLFHSRFYQRRLPRCAQDAFTALSAYSVRVPKTENMVLRILGERLEQLVVEYADAARLDPFEHVARVHAMLIYVMLGLFDGDIRLRHLAETHLSTLETWRLEMLDAARAAANNGQLLMGGLLDRDNGEPTTQVETFWHAWILTESVRRAWFIASGIQTCYSMMREGKLRCAGGLMLTTRVGVWDAKTAWAWTKLCAEKDVGFVTQAQIGRLFDETKPEEVDDFGKLLLEAMYGVEQLESWGVRVEPL